MSQDTSAPTTEMVATLPSTLSEREHRARQHADRILDQFAESFAEKDFFPNDGDDLFFAMLVQLPQWPSDTDISILDVGGDEIACFLKGNGADAIQHTVTLVLHDNGSYAATTDLTPPAFIEEALFRMIFDQLPVSSELGRDGNFPGSNSTSGRIVTVREQIAGLASAERALLFEVLLADAHASKLDLQNANPFLPFWTPSAQDRSLALGTLHVLYPQLPVERLEKLLDDHPLTDAQEVDLVHDETLPEAIAEALQVSLTEWTTYHTIDGLLHTRLYSPDTDARARPLARRLLESSLSRDLVIVERGEGAYEPSGSNDNPVVLWHRGSGEYLREDQHAEQIRYPLRGTDSFYLSILALLQPQERTSLGLHSEYDVKGLRTAVANLAIEDNGGWFSFDNNDEIIPEWLKEASPADKLARKRAIMAYSQTMIEAQVDPLDSGSIPKLRDYARQKLRARLQLDHGLDLEPDEVKLETRTRRHGFTKEGKRPPISIKTQSLTDLSLKNVAFTAYISQIAHAVVDSQGEPISGLTVSAFYDLIRDANVGEAYISFLRERFLTSQEGKWSQARYAKVMHAQMRVDALEAKMAGDFRDRGNLPISQRDRAYKWTMAALDNPVDDGNRAKVEGHPVVVRRVHINGIKLDGLLIFGPSSREAVRSFVIYTPGAPGGKCFRELNDWNELRDLFLPSKPAESSDFLDYLIALAPLESKVDVRRALTVNAREIVLSEDVIAGNFFDATYEAQVERLIAPVDQQTSTAWERDWKRAWEIAEWVIDVVLLFTPFKIRLPIAAIRSLVSFTQGARSAAQGNTDASAFIDGVSFLLDALPGPNLSRIKSRTAKWSVVSRPHSNRVPPKTLEDLERLPLRKDGVHNGVREDIGGIGEPSRFYVEQNGVVHEVMYRWKLDGVNTWRRVDPDNPFRIYSPPVYFESGKWLDGLSVGLKGGGKKGAKTSAQKEKPGTSSGSSTRPDADGSARVFKLDMTDYTSAKLFNKREQVLREQLDKSVAKIIKDFEADPGAHSFHPVEKVKSEVVLDSGKKATVQEKLFTFDIPDMPNDSGRGAWRLKVREPHDNKGVVVFHEVMRTHKSKF